MDYSSIIWDDEGDATGNVQHIAEHDLTVDDVEEVLANFVSEGHSDSTGYPAVWGHVPDGRYIIVVYEEVDEDSRTAGKTKKEEEEVTMAKRTLKRIYRTAKRSAEEVARDEEIRRKVRAEFPPLEPVSPAPILTDPLKNAISRSSKSVDQLAKEANVSQVVLAQFLAGKRDLRLATAEKLAHVLHLRLVAS